MDWMHVVQDRTWWQVLMNMVMNLEFLAAVFNCCHYCCYHCRNLLIHATLCHGNSVMLDFCCSMGNTTTSRLGKVSLLWITSLPQKFCSWYFFCICIKTTTFRQLIPVSRNCSLVSVFAVSWECFQRWTTINWRYSYCYSDKKKYYLIYFTKHYKGHNI